MSAHDAMISLLADQDPRIVNQLATGSEGNPLRSMLSREYLAAQGPAMQLDSEQASEAVVVNQIKEAAALRTWRKLSQPARDRIVTILNREETDAGDELLETMRLLS